MLQRLLISGFIFTLLGVLLYQEFISRNTGYMPSELENINEYSGKRVQLEFPLPRNAKVVYEYFGIVPQICKVIDASTGNILKEIDYRSILLYTKLFRKTRDNWEMYWIIASVKDYTIWGKLRLALIGLMGILAVLSTIWAVRGIQKNRPHIRLSYHILLVVLASGCFAIIKNAFFQDVPILLMGLPRAFIDTVCVIAISLTLTLVSSGLYRLIKNRHIPQMGSLIWGIWLFGAFINYIFVKWS